VDTQPLVKACIAGNRAAEHELFGAYRGTVLRLVWRLLGPRSGTEVDDAVQLVFIELFRSLRAFRGESSLETWVWRVGSKVCVSLLRRKYRKRRIVVDEGDPDVLERLCDGSPDPSGALEQSELAAAIYRALDHIDNDRRVVFVLADIEGKTLEEIAAVVGRPMGTVKSRLFRARRDLAQLLSPLLRD
jgi:RNA polymerase sigma-70 factor (ECF subfamily)